MSGEKKVTVAVEFASAKDARHMAQLLRSEGHEFLPDQIEAALPPEYAEGTVAWVTTTSPHSPFLAVRHAYGWRSHRDGRYGLMPQDEYITKVEPLRVLADDEIAIKVSPAFVYPQNASAWQSNANYMRQQGHGIIADLCERYAKAIALALEAEARS